LNSEVWIANPMRFSGLGTSAFSFIRSPQGAEAYTYVNMLWVSTQLAPSDLDCLLELGARLLQCCQKLRYQIVSRA
jgi:hypothetical protein